ncbi:lectin-like domain-containing protein [Vagococcus intermedius]|uniref:L-type lectin-domain containing protein n=1 Tax=Vagococcus intermedius TaxID=2991418 RepID=A0AAF0CUS3_9ENTE|nr:hypothetical protein [Vagococcus intermedius]WEG73102.1 L-type lectin-domain containing protein [Vagococcus intermedius]WEG75186.1 L-type lectin-domain containing protein [Vagococcus intermedius]
MKRTALSALFSLILVSNIPVQVMAYSPEVVTRESLSFQKELSTTQEKFWEQSEPVDKFIEKLKKDAKDDELIRLEKFQTLFQKALDNPASSKGQVEKEFLSIIHSVSKTQPEAIELLKKDLQSNFSDDDVKNETEETTVSSEEEIDPETKVDTQKDTAVMESEDLKETIQDLDAKSQELPTEVDVIEDSKESKSNSEEPQIVSEEESEENTKESEETLEQISDEIEAETEVSSVEEKNSQESSDDATDNSQETSRLSDVETYEAKKETIEDIVATAPPGLRTTDLFNMPKSKHDGIENKASVMTNKATNTDIVVITPDAGEQIGVIWSKKTYKLNIKKDFKIRAKMYFGNKGTKAADGMTFTLHNPGKDQGSYDENGDAIVMGNAGGSLGVMGRANNKNDKPWEMAVQNAFAIEFDSHVNGSGLDKGIPNKNFHIASYYPAEQNYYANNSGHTLTHDGLIKFAPSRHQSDGKWHDFEIDYKVETQKLTYIYDGQSQTVSLKSELLDLSSAENNSMMYWGFTGATGGDSTTQAVVFEELPDLGNTSNKQDVKKVINNQEESVDNTSDSVQSGDELFYEYKIAYGEGKQVTKQMHLNASLNDLAQVTDESLKKIEVRYQKYDKYGGGELLAPQGNQSGNYQVKMSENGLEFDHLGPLGPEDGEAEYYQSMVVRVPIIVDKKYTLQEPKLVRDNFTIREQNYPDMTKQTNDGLKKSSVEYTINPVKVDLKLDKINDLQRELNQNESSTKEPLYHVSGELKTADNFDLTGTTLRISSNEGGLVTKQNKPVTLETDKLKKNDIFKIELEDNQLIASKKINYQLVDKSGKVLIEKSQIVEDATPPTGDLRDPIYVIKNKLPEDPNIFILNKQDSNDQNQEVKVTYTSSEAMKEAVANTSPIDETGNFIKKQSQLTLTDDAGNYVDLNKKVMIVLDSTLWLEVQDTTLTAKELVKDAPKQPALIAQRERITADTLKNMLREKGLRGNYLNLETQEIEDVTDEINLQELDKVSYQPGTYPIKALLTKGNVEATEQPFKITVTDGQIGLAVEGELTYQPTITSLFNQRYSADNEVILSVKDQRYAKDGWQLDVSAKRFTKDKQLISLEQLELLGKSGKKISSIQRENGFSFSDNTLKSLEKNNLANDQSKLSIQLQTTEGTNWAKKSDQYETELMWQLTATGEEFKTLSFGIPKVRE